jgi:ribosome-associated translation inhibitor RaiA
VSAIEERPADKVQELFDRMDRAECHAHLRTVKFIIELEKADDDPYTRDKELMTRLGRHYLKNEKRILANEPTDQ